MKFWSKNEVFVKKKIEILAKSHVFVQKLKCQQAKFCAKIRDPKILKKNPKNVKKYC